MPVRPCTIYYAATRSETILSYIFTRPFWFLALLSWQNKWVASADSFCLNGRISPLKHRDQPWKPTDPLPATAYQAWPLVGKNYSKHTHDPFFEINVIYLHHISTDIFNGSKSSQYPILMRREWSHGVQAGKEVMVRMSRFLGTPSWWASPFVFGTWQLRDCGAI